MTVRVTHTLGALERDLRSIPVEAATQMARSARTRAEQGNRHAARSARRTAGAHGRHYPDSFRAEAVDPFTWVYGPIAALPQGGMSFEGGSRNQRPHLNLANSADVIGPKLNEDARKMLDRLFW